jgi:hypothetical protein
MHRASVLLQASALQQPVWEHSNWRPIQETIHPKYHSTYALYHPTLLL